MIKRLVLFFCLCLPALAASAQEQEVKFAFDNYRRYYREARLCTDSVKLEAMKKLRVYFHEHPYRLSKVNMSVPPARCLELLTPEGTFSDMDALEVEEETGLDFASLNHGCMHACGHDGHTAILMATAKILKMHEAELNRRVYLVFQPAEETAEGAKFMLKTGILDSVKRIYGVHIFNGIPSGKISLEAGPRMAATNWLAVHLYGKSGHAGKPHEGIDTAVAVSSMVMNLQSIVSRNLNPLDPAVLTIGKIEAGTARNVIAGEAKIEGTARTFSKQAQEMIEERVKDIAKAHEQMYGVDVTVDFQPSSHGALINAPEVVEDVMERAGEVFDPSEFTHVPAMMLGEDFANYLEEIDGCFAFIGGGDHPANHHGKFDFDEKALISGVRLMLTFVIV